MRVVIAGGTGFVGRVLREKLLAAGHEVIVLTRQSGVGASEREKFAVWDGKTPGAWISVLEGADAVINLAGENIAAGKWTAERKQQILSSRVDATHAIVDAIGKAKRRPDLLINVSAVGFYGDIPRAELDETSPAGAGFLPATCVQWEAEAREARLYGTRVVFARLGPVLGENGGMLSRMLPAFRSNMGAPLGSGRQWIPWVHVEDAAAAFLFILERGGFSGPVNITSPEPVTMKTFCAFLAKSLCRPLWFPVPKFVLKLILGEMAAVILGSQKAVPRKLLGAGFRFRYPHLDDALRAVLSV